MKLIITGATGFVGQVAQRMLGGVALEENGAIVELRNRDQLKRTVTPLVQGGCDCVLHLAAQSFIPESFQNPLETYEINFLGTFHLLEALEQAGFRGRMLFVGSGDVYGNVLPEELPIRETNPIRPMNPYAVSKVAGEALCYQWSVTSGFSVTMVRSFNHIGPGQSERFVVSSLAKQIVEIKLGRAPAVIVAGDLDVSRDFLDVRDVVGAYALLLEKGQSGEVYNVCSGRETMLRILLDRMLALAGVHAEIRLDESRLRKTDRKQVCASSEKLRRQTGWEPQIPLDQTLQDILKFWQEELEWQKKPLSRA